MQKIGGWNISIFYLEKILAKFSPQHMTNHPVLSNKAITNTLQPPLSYLEQKNETTMNNLQILKNSPIKMLAKLRH